MFTLVLNNSDELKEIDLYISETFELSTIEIKKYDDKITFIFNNFENSCNSFSLWLSKLIIDLYEKKIIKKIIKKNYFYFEPDEQEKISNISTSIIDENSQSKKDLVFLSVFDYVNDGAISGKIAFAAREEEYLSRENNEKKILVSILFAALLLGLGILFLVWYFFVRPFNDLKVFAEHVS